jgi:hypothetical protein
VAKIAHDASLEEGNGALGGVFEGFAVGWRNIEAAPPNVHLFFAVFFPHFVFVHPLKIAIMTLIEGFIADGGDVKTCAFLNQSKGVLSSDEIAGVGNIELEILELGSGGSGFIATLRGEGDIHPPGEAILQIPKGLAVANND